MKSEDRNRFTQAGDANDDRRSRESGATSRDTDALEAVSDVTSGKGRRDEVGRSGIYPGSSRLADVPGDAELVTPGELGRRLEHDSEAAGEVEKRFDDRLREPQGREDDAISEWVPEPNIVPEGERSER